MNRRIIGILFLITIGLGSCVSYKQAAISKQDIPDAGIYFILHQNKQKFFMYDIDIKNDTVYGQVCAYIDKSLEAKFVHLYLKSDLKIPEVDHSRLEIPYQAIITAEVQKKDKGETFLISTGIFGGYMISMGILILLLSI